VLLNPLNKSPDKDSPPRGYFQKLIKNDLYISIRILFEPPDKNLSNMGILDTMSCKPPVLVISNIKKVAVRRVKVENDIQINFEYRLKFLYPATKRKKMNDKANITKKDLLARTNDP